jgi:uncharacterized radical SAM protein YgiQ
LANRLNINEFIPTSADEVKKRGWKELDVILFTGDAYIDHPSFGIAIIARLLEKKGLRVAVVPQPNWRDDLRDFKKLGKPNLFFGVTAGNMDSMVNHYTANKRLRSDDAYTPGNKAGFRPDYATIVYTKILKQLFPEVPVLLGGIEASMRRLTHYDYWSDTLKPSILVESGADILVYGMAEKSVDMLTDFFISDKKIENIKNINQIAYLIDKTTFISNYNSSEYIILNSYEDCKESKIKFALNFKAIEENSNSLNPKYLIEPYGEKYIVANPAYPPLSEKEMDEIYDLPFTRLPHPRYFKKQPIPAYEMIKNSVVIHRGCFGGCSFCTISAHQGKFISSRSESSILNELKKITNSNGFKGHISDLGGPSANMYKMHGFDKEKCMKCKRPSCLYPNVCKNLNINHTPLLNLYKKARSLNKINKITIGSGIRYDLFLNENGTFIDESGKDYFYQLLKYHVSGRLKVAPEHTSEKVLKLTRKPSFKLFETLYKIFYNINRKYSLNLQLIPYFISGLPDCDIAEMKFLTKKMEMLNIKPEQVQLFTPTPMTLASVMYYTEMDPYTLKKIYIAKDKNERDRQHQIFFWYKK